MSNQRNEETENGKNDAELEKIVVESSTRSDRPVETPLKHRFYRNVRQCLWIYPLLVSIILPGFCIGAYLYAILTKQMKPILPYISDAIGVEPQAGISSVFFDFVTILILITGYLRYKQLKYYIKKNKTKFKENSCLGVDTLNYRNFVSILFLLLGAIGLLILANCRVTENVNLHITGLTFSAVGIGCYFTYMIHVTSYLSSNFAVESKPITLKLTCFFALTCVIVQFILTGIGPLQVGSDNFLDNQWRFNWSAGQPGYWTHVACTAIEWIGIVACGAVLYGCLCRRMRRFEEWGDIRFGL